MPNPRPPRRVVRRTGIAGLAAALALASGLAVPIRGPSGAVLEIVSDGNAAELASPDLVGSPATSATLAPARPATPDPGPDDVRHIADAPTPAPLDSLTGYVWPLPRGRLTLGFGPSRWGSRIVDGVKFHDGIDLATFCGDRIVAAHDGVVLAAGRRYDQWMGWRGDLTPYLDRLDAKGLWITLPIVVVIDDGNTYRSAYAHFSRVVVKPGQVVRAGQLLGYEGRTGRASGCHLHYGLFSPYERDSFGIDPAVVARMLVPDRQVARVDPLLVLPPRP